MMEQVLRKTVREMTLVELVLSIATGLGLWSVISAVSVRLTVTGGGVVTEQLVAMTLGFLACAALLVMVVVRR